MSREISISKNLQILLKKKGLNQVYVSNKLNMNHSTFHGYLNGAMPKGVEGLTKLADFFGISIDELVYGQKSSQGVAEQSEKFEITITAKRIK